MTLDLGFIAILVVGGAFAGFYGSSIGGAALVSFPLLIFAGFPLPMVIASSTFAGTFLNGVSALRYFKENTLRLREGVVFGIIAAIGASLGANIVVSTSETILNGIVAGVFVGILILFLAQDSLGLLERTVSKTHLTMLSGAALFMGFYAGFIGMGVGTLWQILFVFSGFSFIQSAGISRVVGLITLLVATLVFAYHGAINYVAGISLAVGFSLGAWYGAGVAVKKGNNYVRILVIAIVVITILRLLLRLIGVSLF